jgi:hypothetical protein
MRINRSLLNWGVFLIALGGVPLAVDQGWLESDIARDLGQLWPLILVGIGLGLILRWTPLSWFGGALVAATFGVIFGATVVSVRDSDFTDLQGVIPAIASSNCAGNEVGSASTRDGKVADPDEFELDATLSCGQLDVKRAAAATWSLAARHDPDDAPRIEETDRDGATTRLELSQQPGDDLGILGWQARSEWDVEVPSGAALRLDTTLNAARSTVDAGSGPVERVAGTFNASDVRLDLGEATMPSPASVDLTFNASDADVVLPVGDIGAGITLNASSLDLCVPAAAALRVDYSSVLGGDDLGSSGLTEERPGEWITPDFASAGERISLTITNTVSSFSIDRPETCP